MPTVRSCIVVMSGVQCISPVRLQYCMFLCQGLCIIPCFIMIRRLTVYRIVLLESGIVYCLMFNYDTQTNSVQNCAVRGWESSLVSNGCDLDRIILLYCNFIFVSVVLFVRFVYLLGVCVFSHFLFFWFFICSFFHCFCVIFCIFGIDKYEEADVL